MAHTEEADEALVLTPEHHPQRAARLTNLAVLLSDDSTERADRAHLDRAIALYRQALEATERLPDRIAERRRSLALALRDRYRGASIPDDLHEAIELGEAAGNLASALASRFELTGEVGDLDRAIDLYQRALANAADAIGRQPEASGYATNLGLVLATRVRVTGDMADLDQALLHLARSINLLPPPHPDRAHRLANLPTPTAHARSPSTTAGTWISPWLTPPLCRSRSSPRGWCSAA